MNQPIQRGGEWWGQREDGTWLRWNPGNASWEAQPLGPAPPPPPDEDLIFEPRRRRLSTVAVAAVLAVTLLVAGAGGIWVIQSYEGSETTPAPGSPDLGGDAGGGIPGAPGHEPPGFCLTAMTSVMPGDLIPPVETVRSIGSVVERIRGLSLKERINAKFMTRSQLKERVEEEIEKQYPERRADLDNRILKMLRAMDESADIRNVSKKLLASQVAGFYDPETEELVVIGRQRKELASIEEVTLSHEIEHALADQWFDLRFDAAATRANGDAVLARRSVAEGDATITSHIYLLRAMEVSEQQGLLVDPQIQQAARDLEGVPHAIRQSFTFPYTWGVRFVCELYSDGGWDRVDEAYREPPLSSDQVMFPQRYLAGEKPARPAEVAGPPAPWERASSQVVGAADLLWLFEAPGNDPGRALADTPEKAGRLAGGKLVLWIDGRRSALSLSLVARPEAGEGTKSLCAAVNEWFERAIPEPGDSSTVRCTGRRVFVALGPRGFKTGPLTRPL